MRGEHIEGQGWKVPAFIQAFLQKSHYILIVITLIIGGYTIKSGLKNVTSESTLDTMAITSVQHHKADNRKVSPPLSHVAVVDSTR